MITAPVFSSSPTPVTPSPSTPVVPTDPTDQEIVDAVRDKYKDHVMLDNTVKENDDVTDTVKALKDQQEQEANQDLSVTVTAVNASNGDAVAEYLALANGVVTFAKLNETGQAVTEKATLTFQKGQANTTLVVTVTIESLIATA
ncbi:hypothetical protein F9B85_00740 [Heliorestis acidaminivorans]|uniref:Uncharacterized protein n=1 Tax=Heliorestis acidaminivorans TaxID=553427 RepID=A0A6I0ETY7_9FIRM|nr:hypothetical protein [Heliorestis acidaminivorans]KAB2954255.1 hypothetical protein F9B85_00740 [Heliorestis acidaminivorans]